MTKIFIISAHYCATKPRNKQEESIAFHLTSLQCRHYNGQFYLFIGLVNPHFFPYDLK